VKSPPPQRTKGKIFFIALAIKQSLLFESDGSRIALVDGDGLTVKGWDDLDAAAVYWRRRCPNGMTALPCVKITFVSENISFVICNG
jgi:hypothetical protein